MCSGKTDSPVIIYKWRWVIEDFEDTPEKLLVKQEAWRFCSVIASAQDFDSCKLGSTTSKNSIDEMWMSYSKEDQVTWVIDSGCPSHIIKCRDHSLKDTYKPVPKNKRQIRTAPGHLVPSVGIGNVWISIWTLGRGRGSVELCDVLNVPEAGAVNLISTCQLLEKGIAINICNERMEVYNDGLLSAIDIKINWIFMLVTHEIPLDKAFVMSGNNNPQ